MTIRSRSLSALALTSLVAAGTASAIDAGGIAIHGSLSATGAYSDEYDYYGDTGGSFDFNVKEITLNGAYRFENGIRVAAQVYAYDLAGYKDLTLDFATLDYAFGEKMGVRVGRNKLPVGFYGEVQDLDQIRTFASLPLNFYPRGLRSLTASYNGAGLYGTISLKNAGSLEYQVIAGWMENTDVDAPYARSIVDLTETDKVDSDRIYGGTLIWNTRAEGLRFGYTINYMPGLELNSRVQTRAGLAEVGSSYAAVAEMIDMGFGEGTWDFSGLFAGSLSTVEADIQTHVASVEYSRERWVLAAEYRRMETEGTTSLFASAPLLVVNAPIEAAEEHWYAQATYQATDKLGLGVYYAQSDFDPKNQDARDGKFTSMNDLALGASYAVTDNWLVKIEGHALDGLGKLNIAGDRNFGATDARWNYFVVKTTFSF